MIPPPPDKYAKRGIRCTLDGFQVGEDGPHRYTRVLALIPLVWSGLQRARTGIYAVCESTSTAAAQTVRGAPVVRVEPCSPRELRGRPSPSAPHLSRPFDPLDPAGLLLGSEKRAAN